MKKTAQRDYEEIVRDILTHYPEARDSDPRLYWLVASAIGKSLKDRTALEFFTMLQKRSLPAYTTVIRNRALVQQKDETLRGKSYIARKQASKQIRLDLGYDG